MPLKPADTLLNGQHRILRQLGRGGFGFVYLAQDTLLGEKVAIKELIPALVGDETMLRRFLVEAKATMRLRHARIVATHNVFSERGNYYIVMEYVAGGSLEQRLQGRGTVPIREALRIAIEVCGGLSYAHGLGVVHCELKPANILFATNGSSKVADFGIAHVSGEGLTRTWHTPVGFVAGTLPYMSPEQAEGVRDHPRVDVYAMGAVLYRMLTGRTYLEFEERETPAAQADNVYRIRHRQPKPPSAHNRHIPDWLDAVVIKALAKRSQDRYATADGLRAALVQQGATVLVRPKTMPPPARPVPVRRPHQPQRAPLPSWLWPAVGGIAVLVVVLTIAFIALMAGGDGRTEKATLEPTHGAVVVLTATSLPLTQPLPTDSSFTPPPTPATAASGATATATSSPRLSGDPSAWLPSQDDIPNEMYLWESRQFTNEDIAKLYDNPTDMFNRLQEWGRVMGHGDDYLHQDGCEAKTGLREIFVEAVLFETELGARQASDWIRTQREQQFGPLETAEGVGEQSHFLWSDITSDCTPPDDLRSVHLSFQRYNGIGVAEVASVKGTMSDQDMKALCIRLAQLIELRFIAEAK